MAKRFGRNQKRKMREDLVEAHASNTRLLTNLELLRSEVRDAKSILVHNSIAFEASNLEVTSREIGRIIKLPVYSIKHSPYADDSDFATFRDIPLYVLTAKTSKDFQQHALHVRVTFKDKVIGYALSDEALHSTPQKILIQRMSEEIATMLMNELKINE